MGSNLFKSRMRIFNTENLKIDILPVYKPNNYSDQKKKIIIVFRYDDYSTKSSIEVETKIIEAFQENNSSFTIGVIPYVSSGAATDPSHQDTMPLSQIKGAVLKDALNAGVVDIALHGYAHQTIYTKRGYTEFSGLGYKNQLEKIRKGLGLLREMTGAPIVTFIPPWNSYDMNTLRALEELQFVTISGSQKGESEEMSGLKFLPGTCGLLNLRNVVDLARKSTDISPIIVVTFHEYDFLDLDKKRGIMTIDEFRKVIVQLNSQKDLSLASIGLVAEFNNDLSVKRYLTNKYNYTLSKLLPRRLRPNLQYVYLSTRKALTIFYIIIGFLFSLIVSLGAFFFLFY